MSERFSSLPVGTYFELDGESYIKATPLIARCEQTGRQRLVPRSATVKRLEARPETREGAPATASALTAEQVREALQRLHERLEDAFGDCASACNPSRLEAQLAEAFTQARRELGI